MQGRRSATLLTRLKRISMLLVGHFISVYKKLNLINVQLTTYHIRITAWAQNREDKID